MNPSKDLKSDITERLDLPRAILIQLRETRLFNSMVDQAIEDIDWIIKKDSEK